MTLNASRVAMLVTGVLFICCELSPVLGDGDMITCELSLNCQKRV